jgi:PTS system beta-glucosides-specific IIC component
MEGIITVIKSGGQFKVVIGNHVSHVFEEITPIIGESNGNKQAATSNGNVFNRLIDILFRRKKQ